MILSLLLFIVKNHKLMTIFLFLGAIQKYYFLLRNQILASLLKSSVYSLSVVSGDRTQSTTVTQTNSKFLTTKKSGFFTLSDWIIADFPLSFGV